MSTAFAYLTHLRIAVLGFLKKCKLILFKVPLTLSPSPTILLKASLTVLAGTLLSAFLSFWLLTLSNSSLFLMPLTNCFQICQGLRVRIWITKKRSAKTRLTPSLIPKTLLNEFLSPLLGILFIALSSLCPLSKFPIFLSFHRSKASLNLLMKISPILLIELLMKLSFRVKAKKFLARTLFRTLSSELLSFKLCELFSKKWFLTRSIYFFHLKKLIFAILSKV